MVHSQTYILDQIILSQGYPIENQSRIPLSQNSLLIPGAVGDHKATTATNTPSQSVNIIYYATGFTCYTHSIALYDIHLKVDLSDST